MSEVRWLLFSPFLPSFLKMNPHLSRFLCLSVCLFVCV